MLTRLTLRTRFLALLLLGVLAVTIATLVVVRDAVVHQIRAEIVRDLRNSVMTFKTFQSEREETLTHSARLLADLPLTRALMSTGDPVTIQDEVDHIWSLSGGNILILGAPDRSILAINSAANPLRGPALQETLKNSRSLPDSEWWFLNGHLYEVFLEEIHSGSGAEEQLTGVLALGYEIDAALAANVSQITGSQVTFLNGDSVIATTLAASGQPDVAQKIRAVTASADPTPEDLQLGNERYLSACVELIPGKPGGPRLDVLQSYDAATARFLGLYRILLGLGILSLFGVSLLAFGIFRRYTGPLEKLVAAVRALGKGDFRYPLEVQGKDELAEATASFIRMRDDLQQAQRKLLETERLATIGRMASSISHDLRHQLTSIVANSEFLSEPDLDREQQEELYQEIRDAVGRMTELIDSLLEFSRGRDALSLSYGSIEQTMRRAVHSVNRNPSVQDVAISVSSEGACEGWFDSRRMERAFYNLLLNACQAVAPHPGKVQLQLKAIPQGVEIYVRDNGSGIPEPLRDKIFEPFVSHGKEHGTGLGLTIVQKIVEEHGGTIRLADSSPGNTAFHIVLPLRCNPEAEVLDDDSSMSPDNITSAQ